MKTKIQIDRILSEVAVQAKLLFTDKLKSVILFGSYARGDFDEDSDIDIMILADIASQEVCSYTGALRDRVFELEIECDCVLSLCVVPQSVFARFKDILPFYKNVQRDGVRIEIQ